MFHFWTFWTFILLVVLKCQFELINENHYCIQSTLFHNNAFYVDFENQKTKAPVDQLLDVSSPDSQRFKKYEYMPFDF